MGENTVMANQQIAYIPATDAAVTSPSFPTNMYDEIIVTTDHLAGGETVNIQVVAGTTAVQVLLLDGTTLATLTATLQGLILEGGPSYVFVKSVTANPCGVYIDCKQK
jgi:hypothetical protein